MRIAWDRGAFFDVIIASDARPGHYHGVLHIGILKIPVLLVIELVLIDIRAEPLVWVWYDPTDLALAHGLVTGSAEALALERTYAELFRAHGAFILGVHNPEELRPREEFARGATYWPVRVDRSDDDGPITVLLVMQAA